MDVRSYGFFETFVGISVCRGAAPHCRRRGVVSAVLQRPKGLYRRDAGAGFPYGKGDDVT